MAWTTVSDANLAADAPARSADIKAIRDNITAVANGDPGAPSVQTAAIANSAVTNDKVANGSIGAEKLQTGTTERDWILARNAGLSAGAVGTYGFFNFSASTIINPGDTTAGSNLFWSSVSSVATAVTTSPSGTWRMLGYKDSNTNLQSLWVRIS